MLTIVLYTVQSVVGWRNIDEMIKALGGIVHITLDEFPSDGPCQSVGFQHGRPLDKGLYTTNGEDL